MKKYVVISTDCNKEYSNLIPLTCYSWEKIGYTPIVIEVARNTASDFELPTRNMQDFLERSAIVTIEGIDGIKDGSVAQISRLFISCISPFIGENDIIVTSDSDMVIAKDIFTEDGDIISYGHDLTGFAYMLY